MRFLMIVLAFVVLSVPAMAQGYSQMFEQISGLNRTDPAQNPKYTKSSDLFGRNVLDKKNKVVGRVQDVVLDFNGGVESLNINFKQLRLNGDVYVSYNDAGLRTMSNAYAFTNYDDDQIEALYPEMLANIATASGRDDDAVSLKSLIGAPVRSEDGRVIGKVDEILFLDGGGFADVLYVSMISGPMRGETLAFPFQAARYSNTGARKQVTVSKDQTRAILDYLDDRRGR